MAHRRRLRALGERSQRPLTDDASVRANLIGIAPHVSGPLTELHVVDNQPVHTGRRSCSSSIRGPTSPGWSRPRRSSSWSTARSSAQRNAIAAPRARRCASGAPSTPTPTITCAASSRSCRATSSPPTRSRRRARAATPPRRRCPARARSSSTRSNLLAEYGSLNARRQAAEARVHAARPRRRLLPRHRAVRRLRHQPQHLRGRLRARRAASSSRSSTHAPGTSSAIFARRSCATSRRPARASASSRGARAPRALGAHLPAPHRRRITAAGWQARHLAAALAGADMLIFGGPRQRPGFRPRRATAFWPSIAAPPCWRWPTAAGRRFARGARAGHPLHRRSRDAGPPCAAAAVALALGQAPPLPPLLRAARRAAP